MTNKKAKDEKPMTKWEEGVAAFNSRAARGDPLFAKETAEEKAREARIKKTLAKKNLTPAEEAREERLWREDQQSRLNARNARGYAKGGKVSKASSRADGAAKRGKTRGRVI